MLSQMGSTVGICSGAVFGKREKPFWKAVSCFADASLQGAYRPGLEGMKEEDTPDPDLFRMYIPDIAAFTEAGYKPGETVICTGKIKHVGSTYTDQFDYLKSLLPTEKIGELKLTLAAPNWYHLRYKEGRAYPREIYKDDDAYFADIAKAYQAELKILYDHGLRNVQFDDPNLAYFCSEAMIAGWNKDPLNTYSTDVLLDKYIKLYNDCISQAPEDMHIGVHLCRGTAESAALQLPKKY